MKHPTGKISDDLLHALPLPVWTADSEGRLIAANDLFRSLAGDGETLDEIMEPAEAATELLTAARDQPETAARVEATFPAGDMPNTLICVEAMADQSNGALKLVGWAEPVEGGVNSAEWLVNQVAHALRNPIFAALVQAEAMSLRLTETPTLAKPIGILFRQLKRLEQTIDEMLLYGRPAKIARRQLRISDVIAPIIGAYHQGKGGEPAQLELIMPQGDLEAHWDERAVRVILERLLNNAVEHTEPPHHVTLRIEPHGAEEILLSVSDQGSGLSETVLPRAFLPFFPQHRGRPGLGLAIVRKYAQVLGGRVELQSSAGEGTEVRCFLPVTLGVNG